MYKIYKFPNQISSSDFIKLVKASQVKNVSYFGFLVSFNLKHSNQTLLSNYATYNIDNFNNLLESKNIKYNHYDKFESLFYNPYNQIISLSSIFTYSLINLYNDSNRYNKNSIKNNMDYYINKYGSYNLYLNSIFKDLVTSKENKDSFILAVDQLVNTNKYKENNIRPIKGMLLYGKPGTGKTLVAKCLSKLKEINFINTCSSEYVEIYVGTGAKKVREYFKEARHNKPSIIFIDELEAIGMQRSNSYSSYSNNIERNATLNQLLAEMDGIEANEGILVIAATNREDLLDPALIRPGRFDIKINLDLPNKQERKQLFELYLKKQEILLSKYSNKSLNYNNNIIDKKNCIAGYIYNDILLLDELSEETQGMTGAIIEDIVNKTAMISYSKNQYYISKEDLIKTLKTSKDQFIKFKNFEYKNNKST